MVIVKQGIACGILVILAVLTGMATANSAYGDVNSATYSAVNDTITVTSGSPTYADLYTFEKLYNWNQITSCGTDCYTIAANVITGTGTGIKIDTNVTITTTGTGSIYYLPYYSCPPCPGTPCVSGTYITSWMEDNVMLDIWWMVLFLAFALTVFAWWSENWMAAISAAAMWIGGALLILTDDTLPETLLFVAIPALIYSIYLMFELALIQFRGGGTVDE